MPLNKKIKKLIPKMLKSNLQFSRKQIMLFMAVFALIGGYTIYRSFAAAPLVATLEAEQMSLPAGGSVVTDTTASSGKALYMPSSATITGLVNFASPVNSVTVVAKGGQCNGAPTMNVVLDGTTLLNAAAVSSTNWAPYSASLTNQVAAGTHTLSISFVGDYTKNKGNPRNQCSRTLSVDVSNFYGPLPVQTPAPTVSLSATPSTLAAGDSATLTWNSTDATSCSASGAWSGTQPTSGSVSTGALNQSSTYTLTCTGAGGSASASAVVSVSSSLVVTSSLQNNATISGMYPWTITTNVAEGQVEYFFENVSLGKVPGSTAFTYNLDTTKYSNAGHNGGYWVYDSAGTVVYKSPSINFTINNTTSGGGGGTGTGTVLNFGSFDSSNLADFSDSTCHSSNMAVHVGGGPNNRNWARFTGTSSTQCYGDTANIRVHALGFPAGTQSWFNNGGTAWRALSIRIPSGYSDSSNGYLYAGDEIHGDNGTGPAPLNIDIDNGYWKILVRGSNQTTTGSSYNFAQYQFGQNPGNLYSGAYYRRWQDWAGGNKPVVADEWVHFRLGFHFDTTDNNGVGNGWFEAWARWGNMTSWVNIVPRVSNIPVGYPDVSGDGSAIYPMLSLYRPTSGASGTYAIDYSNGAWSNDYNTLVNWQNSRLGF